VPTYGMTAVQVRGYLTIQTIQAREAQKLRFQASRLARSGR